ncbi:MAG: hypothetical protein ACTSQG_01910 [Promethearchaeota archaeon]
MIQGILTYQFILNQQEDGSISPEFKPIQLIFKEFEDKKYTRENYSDLIVQNDIFAIFYQHTTGIYGDTGGYSNFYTGRLKETPYQVMSYFKQEADGSQFLTISIFELDDEIEIFEEQIKNMAKRLDVVYETLTRAKHTKQISLLTKVNTRIENELKFTIFQVERLSELDKLQKAALIFHSEERLKILEILREKPVSKREMKNILEKIKANPNVDILIEPFLELNLIRRDWIKGEKDKKTMRIEQQGEYLFLTKDIILARIPSEEIAKRLKENRKDLYPKYNQKVIEYFSKYNPNTQSLEEIKKIASLLLNPDIYDFIALMRNNYYPLDKIPKILSDWADTEMILDELTSMNILTEIEDNENKKWLLLLTDITPIIIFPEYLLPKIREAYFSKDLEKKITYEIAKKAYDLLEVTFPESVEF